MEDMEPMSFRMTGAEREDFLTGVHVGILSIPEPGRGPLTAPIWYGYEPGSDLWCVVGRDSRKGRLLHKDLRVSLCAQTERDPYQYASIEGPVTVIKKANLESEIRPLARRYLGREGGDQYVDSEDHKDSILVCIRPERWLTADYGKW
jgi:PPOX class probable F420-dependent enzyme